LASCATGPLATKALLRAVVATAPPTSKATFSIAEGMIEKKRKMRVAKLSQAL